MLNSLLIRNYALIKKLDVTFYPGFSIITGETGAGKSILLGALGLLVGQRADTSVLDDKKSKCIVEADFNIEGYNLESVFHDEDVDYESHTIIRREIHASGKSRAFVNDTPVNLAFLKTLGEKLIDIHSQHQTLIISDRNYQLKIIDTLSGSLNLLDNYKKEYGVFLQLDKEVGRLKDEIDQAKADFDYYSFQYSELEKLTLTSSDVELEQEYEALIHLEEIKSFLGNALQIFQHDETGVLQQLRGALSALENGGAFLSEVRELASRTESSYIELKDIANEVDLLFEKQELDPRRLDELRSRLDLINSLYSKHQVSTIEELLQKQEQFKQRMEKVTLGSEKLDALANQLNDQIRVLEGMAAELSTKRQAGVNQLSQQMKQLFEDLGLPHAVFEASLMDAENLTSTGKDIPGFYFSANQGGGLKDIAKVASGGELSRLMLGLKSIVADKLQLPTLVFDEIDSGVSGEIADKVGNIIRRMAENMQVFNITHLPQVAGKGTYHYKVYKSGGDGDIQSHIKLLDNEERRIEIAQMLSGENLTEAALSNADELLGNV